MAIERKPEQPVLLACALTNVMDDERYSVSVHAVAIREFDFAKVASQISWDIFALRLQLISYKKLILRLENHQKKKMANWRDSARRSVDYGSVIPERAFTAEISEELIAPVAFTSN